MRIKEKWLNWRELIIDDRDLTFGAKGIGLYLNTYMNGKHDFAFPSITTITGEMNIARATAIKYLDDLENNGYLQRERRFGKSIIYHSIVPEKIKIQLASSSHAELTQADASSSDSVLVEGLNHSSSELEPPVVQDLNPNKQYNKQTNKQRGFVPPTVEQVEDYVSSREIKIDPAEFIDHYEANGWYRGKTKIKNWQACVRTWEKNKKLNGKKSLSETPFKELVGKEC